VKIRWLAIASSDLEHLYQYIAQDNPDAADNEVEKVLEAAGSLTKMSGLGRPGRVPDTRELVVSQYIIAYRAREGRVEILRVLHQAQRWPDMIG
jgi:toxin ParE1/3/4